MPAGLEQIERAAATRAALVAAARRLFVTRGYADTGTEELVAAANLTRGALYHHFRDKRDLFRAVFNEIGAEVLAGRIGAGAASGEARLDPWAQLGAGLRRFLRTAAVEPEVQRITLIDGPSVLGWEEWSELEERFALHRIEAAIRRSIDAGVIRPLPPRELAHLLLGIVNSGGLLVAHSPSAATERQVVAALDGVLDGLRTTNRRKR